MYSKIIKFAFVDNTSRMSRSLAGSVTNIEASAVSGIDLGRRPEAVIPDAAESVTRIGMKIDHRSNDRHQT